MPYGATETTGPEQPTLAFVILSGVNGHVFHELSEQNVYNNIQCLLDTDDIT